MIAWVSPAGSSIESPFKMVLPSIAADRLRMESIEVIQHHGGRRTDSSDRPQELQPVAERIVDVDALVAFKQVVVDHLVAGGAGSVGKALHVVDAKGDVR